MYKPLKVLVAFVFPVALLLVLAVLLLRPAASPAIINQSGGIELQDKATPTHIDGRLNIGKTDQYTVHIEAGQPLLALLISPKRDVVLSIRGADGRTFWHEMSTAFFGVLPTTQHYVLSVTATRTDANYRLSLQLAPHVTARTAPSLQPRVDAAPVKVAGQMNVGQIDAYRSDASNGQVMSVDVWNSFPGEREHFQVMDVVINNANGEALFGGSTFWFGELPSSQSYAIHLIPSAWPEGVTQLEYDLSLGLYATAEAQAPTRIEAPTNQPWATVEGKIRAIGKPWGRNRYLVSAAAGQRLTLHLTSAEQASFRASVRGADGKLLAADYTFLTGFSNPPLNEYTLELPASQDYTISIIGDEGATYTLRATLRP